MKTVLLALLLCGILMATSVRPDFFEVKDTGDKKLPITDVELSINCDSKDITVKPTSHDTGAPITNAKTYIFFTQYTYQLLTTGTTDSDGVSTLHITGTVDYLTALFILRVDSPNHQSREIEFAYEKCFKPQPAPAPPKPNETKPVPPPPPVQPPQNQTNGSVPTTIKPPENTSGQMENNSKPSGNGTTGPAPTKPPTIPCLPGLLLIPLMIASRR